VTDESVMTHHASDRTDHRLFLKFRGNVKIPQRRANSMAWLEISRPVDNSGP